MSTIKELQEALPFFVNLPPVPKVILSAVLLGLTAFILALIWTPPPPPPDTAVTEILNKCYRRALFTRMHAQQSLPAMYASIDQCREAVQIGIPLNTIKGAASNRDRTSCYSGSNWPVFY
jgi:hypothetical protein